MIRRQIRRNIAGGGVAFLAMLALASPAHGATFNRAARPTIRVVDRTMYVGPEDTLVIRIAITDPPPDATLNLFVGKKITSIAALDSPIDQQFSGRNLYDARPDLATTPRDASGNLELSIRFSITKPPNTDDVNIRLKHPGVYPVGLELVDVDEQVVASTTTHFVRYADPTAARNVAVTTVAHLEASPTIDATGHVAINHDDIVAWTSTLQFLADRPEIPVALSVPTDLIDALDATNSEQSALLGLLNVVMQNKNLTVVSSPAFSMPISEALTSGFTGDVTRQIEISAAKIKAQFNRTVDQRTIASIEAITPTAADAFTTLGYSTIIDLHDQKPPTSAVYAPPNSNIKIVTPNSNTLTTTSNQKFAPILERAMLEWSIRTIPDGDQPGESVNQLININADTIKHGDQFDTLIAELLASPIGRLVTLAEIPRTNAPTYRFGPTVLTPQLGDVAALRGQATAALNDLASLGSAIPSAQSEEFRRRLSYLVASHLTPAQRRAYVEVITAAVRTASQNVSPMGDETFTLTSRQGEIPLTVMYTGTVATQATLRLDSSDRLTYPNGDTTNLTLNPGKNQVTFTVRAKTSGVQTILVRLTSPDGRIEFSRGRITIRSTVVSGVGIVLSTVSLVVLVLWWIRHWRRARTQTPTELTESPGQ